MSRKYTKSKSQGGGAGLHFDKLLKACSNSKKPSATKTAGALGRFGTASFTSTRKTSYDAVLDDDEPRFTPLKRARLDLDRNLQELGNDSIRYGVNVPSRPSQDVPLKVIPKPKKFFKSRNPDSDQNVNISDPDMASPSYLPPLPMPIKIPTPRLHQGAKKSTGKRAFRKDSTSSSDAEVKSLFYATASNTNDSRSSSTSPIKLRIFKDKKTARLVSVSDAVSPPTLELQVQKDENILDVHPKKRGRKPKPLAEVEKPKPVKPEPAPLPQRRSGRLTRNSLRQRSSDSVVEMPTHTAADETVGSEDTSSPLQSPDPDPELIEKVDSAEKLVQRLEEEDQEFRELSAMLSSMEDVPENVAKCDVKQEPEYSPKSNYLLSDESHQENTNTQYTVTTPEPSPINYSLTAATGNHSAAKELYVDTNQAPLTRDFRSILEDEWDESCEEESPRRCLSLSPTKVTRFDMPDMVSPQRRYVPNSEHRQHPTPVQAQVSPQLPLNSSYAVRNLLSEITGSASDLQDVAVAAETFITMPVSVPDANMFQSDSPTPLTPEKPTLAKDLIGSAKKVSIFKSRMNATSSESGPAVNPKKRLALYKHKFGQEATENQDKHLPTPAATTLAEFEDTFGDASEPLSLRRRARLDEDGNEIVEGSKVYCSQQTKKLFTVVRNVKAIHELQESGEVHEFDGDIWYILEDLKATNPVSKRCLSAITLATRCMEPGFRMHLRAHGTVAEFCRELRDAPNNIPVLALAAATVLFVLSQDRLNMDLDTESFLLILALAKTEENSETLEDTTELSKHRQRIIDLVAEMKSRGHAKHIKIEKISASELALETLLFLTSKRAGEWVKRELRTLGGLDFIVTEIEKAFSSLENRISELGWTENLSNNLWKIDRCLKVLQQVTFNHEENQKYLLGAENQAVEPPPPSFPPQLLVRLLRFLCHHLSCVEKESEHFAVLREVLFSDLRVLVNLSHDYRGVGSEILSKEEGFLHLTLHSIFSLSVVFEDGKGFDLLMHALCMLLNIVEHSKPNRELILSMTVQFPGSESEPWQELSTLDALIRLFFKKEREAQKEEASTDDILTNSTDKKDADSQASESQNSSQESESSVQDIIDKLIETAGKHMENSMIAAHVSLLIAYLVMNDPESTSHLLNAMPSSSLLPLMILLKKLFNFMSITTSVSEFADT